MSDTHASTAPDSYAAGVHVDDHGHAEDTIGPTDVTMWGVGIAGVIAAIVVIACFALATGFSFVA